jgi:ankyrin repeat protein
MNLRHIVGRGALMLLLSMTTDVARAASTLADAVMRGDTAAVRALLKQHADVNATQADGSTPLHWAVHRSDRATADQLIRAGANVKTATRQ